MNGRGTPYRSARGYVPPKSRRIDALTVHCPDCKAEPRSRCVTLGVVVEAGREQRTAHPVRRRMAVRQDNATRDTPSLPS